MPAQQPRFSRLGSWTEILVEACLKTVAFTARIPHEEDIGHDFFCTLAEPHQDGLFKAGPSFTVQAKSIGDPLVVFKTAQAIEWLQNLQNPFFVAVGNREEQRVEIYSTWERFKGFVGKTLRQIKLQPGPPTSGRPRVWTTKDGLKQIIALGEPIIRADVREFMDEERATEFRGILCQWITLDRQNIVNVEDGLNWIIGSTDYHTNERLSPNRMILWPNADAKNYGECARHFGRAATALRITLHNVLGGKEDTHPDAVAKIKALDEVLRRFGETLDSPSCEALRYYLGWTVKCGPTV